MKNLWLARLARPDLIRPVCKLATKIQKWSRNDDRRLKRMMEYMNSTINQKLRGFICDSADDLELWLFADADLAGDPDSSRSSSGGYLVLIGPKSWFPLSWIFHKQTATSRSTTEAESVSLANGLSLEAFPMLDLVELVLERKVILRSKEDNQATIKIMKKRLFR